MTQRVRKDGRESVPSPPANRRRQCLSTMLLIVAVTGGAMAGWIAGRRHVQTMLNDVDDLGETVVVSFFHEGGTYDLLIVLYAVVGAALGLAIVVVPTVLTRFFNSGRQFRAANSKARNELTQAMENAPS